MISLQSHNQVLYHLTQLTSAVSPKSTPLPVKVKKRNESCKKSNNDASYTGITEAAKNYSEMSIGKINMYEIATTFRMKKNNVWVILDQLSMSTCKRHVDETSKWKTSYVSKSSFAKNKQSFPCPHFTEPIILPAIHSSPKRHRTICTFCVKNPFIYHVQVRNFKTERSMKKTDVGKTSPIMTKITKWIYPREEHVTSGTTTQTVKDADFNKLKDLFDNSTMSAEEKQRVRHAFAEGFDAGIRRQSLQKSMSWLKIVNYVILGIFVITGLSNLASPGSMIRFAMRQRGEINPEAINVTFDDVKGIEEAKQELRDVVEFLKNPDKFSVLGGKLPKGVLLVGPPGTGKTLLARAVAGEAGVPFFHASGSEFDEILVGQGARRVRDLFNAAKTRAPAVIFIDEIDSVGAKRTTSVLHPYANQTINQLLAEMDGFLQNEGVIVLGATNRREDLDKALMRPGRFDVEIFVDKPDYVGRKEILDLYLARILTRDVDVEYLARCTSGFTGADIENMINQAALNAAKNDAPYVTMKHLEYARDKVIMGPEGKLKANAEESNRITAYHEAGHALVAYFTKDSVPIHKVTIIPRGASLGHTSYVHEKDVYHITKSQLLANMDTMMGGRAAEELIFGPDRVTTGASNDFEKATMIAEQMVKSYGMSDKVGFRTHTDNKSQKLMGNSSYGPSTQELIDNEVKRLLQESYDRAKMILKNHAKEHKQLADALLKYETLSAEDVKAIVNGKKSQPETINNPALIVDAGKQVL